MNLNKFEPKIGDDDPFENDLLERKKSAEVLKNLLGTLDGSFVLAVNADWGQGKTTFIKMFSQYLKNDGFETVYYNAWENDYTVDPLVSLIGELDQVFKTKGEQTLKTVKLLGYGLVKQSLKFIPMAASAVGGVPLGVPEKLTETTGKVLQEVSENFFNKVTEEKENTVKFKKALEEAVKTNQNNSEKPLIFFIDELDRCRPTYAVELLERIKHFFEVKGIVFVLAVDLEQIAHAVKTLYGSGMDADGYLRRFIDLIYKLPEPEPEIYANFLMKALGIDEVLGKLISPISDKLFQEFCISYHIISNEQDFSLRDHEKCLLKANLVLRTFKLHDPLFIIYLPMLLILQVKHPVFYKKYISQEISEKELNEIIKYQNITLKIGGNNPRALRAFEFYFKFKNGTAESIGGEYRILNKSNDEIGDHLFNLILPLRDKIALPLNQYLAKRIELAENFTQPLTTPEEN